MKACGCDATGTCMKCEEVQAGSGMLSDEEYARFAVKAASVEAREINRDIDLDSPPPNIPPGGVYPYTTTEHMLASHPPMHLMTPRERLYAAHARITAEAFAIMQKKNEDYATAEDPLLNFRIGGLIGIAVRKCDKAVRDVNLLKKGSASVAESRRDTLLDEINYAILELFAEEEGMKP